MAMPRAQGVAHPLLRNTGSCPPIGLPSTAGTPPPGEALHEGIAGTGVIADITADCGVCKQKIEWPGSVIIGKYLSI